MLDKKITRKEFLYTVGSFVGLLALNSVSKTLADGMQKKDADGKKHGYGNNSYGGKKA